MKQILNLWCGKGQNIPHILQKGHITNVDIEQQFIDMAKKKFPQCDYLCCPAENLNFPDEYFDEIYAFDVLEHVKDLDIVMNKLHKLLKKDWLLYVEVPYDKSELALLKINPDYHNQIGHERIFYVENIHDTFWKYWFQVDTLQKQRWIAHIYLWILFKLNIPICDQMCTIQGKHKIIERLLFMVEIWFDEHLFHTWLKYIPVWIITIPVGKVISMIFPKTIVLYCSKKNVKYI